MKEERMKILDMLQEGKITAEEAANLMEQIPEKRYMQQEPSVPSIPPVSQVTQVPPTPSVSQMPQSNDGGLFDWIKGSFLNSGVPRITLDFSSSPVGNGIAVLRMTGKNDSVSIEGYRGDNIRVHCHYIPISDVDPQITLKEENGVYELLYNPDAVKALKISCRVPMVMIDQLHAKSSNGRIKLENIKCSNLEGHTGNAAVKLEKAKAEKITFKTTNGKIDLEDVEAHSAQLRTINGKIDLDNADIVNIFAETTNGALKFGLVSPADTWAEERVIDGKTTNGSISLDLPRGLGVKLEASTTNSQVVCDIQDTIFGEVSRKHINGSNQRYESADKRINIKLSTTNGAIKVKEV